MPPISRPLARLVLCLAASLAIPAHAQTIDRLWSNNCQRCHGESGRGGNAKSLLDDAWEFGGSDRELFDSIKQGRPDAGMEAFGGALDDPQVWSLVVAIREMHERARRERVGSPRPDAAGVYRSQRHAFRIETIIDAGLSTPWAIDFLPDGRMLVTSRSGALKVHSTGKPGGVLSPAVAGTPAVRNRGQGGLLDVAVHPDYASNGWVYLSFADSADGKGGGPGMTKVVRGKLSPDGTAAGGAALMWTDQQTIFEARKEHYLPTDVHFGCHIVFGPPTANGPERGTRHVYFCIGERGRAEFAQDLTRPNGKVHRLDDDGSIPPDNPFASAEEQARGVYASIWSIGHRNPQGLAIDPAGRLWETEHGPRGGDELNLIERGRNYGWPTISFGINYNGTPFVTPWPETIGSVAGAGAAGNAAAAPPNLTLPVLTWTPSIAASGLHAVRAGPAGEAFPDWRGDLLAGGLVGETIRRLRVAADGRVTEQEELLHGLGRVRDVVCGPDGSIYIALNEPDKVIRLISAEPAAAR